LRLSALVLPLALVACSPDGEAEAGAGPRAARDYQLSGFTSVELKAVDDVVVRQGAAFAVQAEGPTAVLDQLEIRVEGQALVVSRRSGFSGRSDSAKVTVTMPVIAAARLTGAGDLSIDRVVGRSFSTELLGTGDLDVNEVKVESLSIDLTGAGQAELAGTTKTLSASLRGAGDLDASKLTAETAQLSMKGVGSLEAHVTGAAAVSLSGLGSIKVTGGARCVVNRSGLGDVTCS
jgi:hypothetical protein